MNKENLKKYLLERATITINATQDDLTDIKDHFTSGEADYIDLEAKEIAEIYERLNQGDVWAFANVNVKASFQGFEGNSYLGACSYKDESDFRQDGGYFTSMVDDAIDDLAYSITFTKERLDNIKNAVDDANLS